MTTWVQRRSFQGRLTALVAVAVGLAVALVAIASYFAVSHQLYSQVDSHLESTQAQIREGADGFNADHVLEASEQNGNIVEFVPEGAAPQTDTAPGSSASTTLTPTRAQRAVAKDPGSFYRLDTVSQGGVRYRVLTMPVLYNSSPGASGQPASLLIATSLTSTLHTLARLRLILYVLFLAGVALAVIFGLTISRLTLRPVRRLTAAAEHVAATQELDASIEVESSDELGRLAHSFNEMLDALGASRRQQAQLVSDAGHELRTPLTSLRTNVELMMRAKQLPEADQRELYGDITAQVEELTTLIGDLVELARQDEQQPEPVEVRLDSIVERSVARAQRRAPSVTFDVELTAGSVRAQPPLLERAVLNVLDNAAKWAPAGTTVRVRLQRGAAWLLEVSDQGPGIAAEDQPHIFDRFYRAATARSMPGSGLGLAIVRQAVEAHGGRVSIVSPAGRGSDVGPGHGGGGHPVAVGPGTMVRIELPIVVEQEPPRPAGDAAGPGFSPPPPGMPPPPTAPPPTTAPPTTAWTGPRAGELSPSGISPGSGRASP